MKEIEIILEKEIGKDLGTRHSIEEIFQNINSNVTKVTMNFKNIEFMGRAFAQEYLNQKYIAPFEVIEVNVSEDIEKLFNIILKLNNRI